nr:amidase family protein [Halomonas sp. PA5]
MTDSPLKRPLRELYAELRGGKLTATALAEASLEANRIRCQHNHAYLTWNGEAAPAFAQATDAVICQGGDAGALMGIPVSVKDIYAVPGLPTYAGSSQRLPLQWEQPGPMIEALLAHLPSVMGKTHSVEFAFGGLGQTPTGAHPVTPGIDKPIERPAAPVPEPESL